MKALLFFVTCLAYAQPITIAAGSPADQFFSGGTGGWAMPTPAYPFLRYGTSFSYNVPLSNGFYNIAFVLIEPNKTAPSQRVFSITANGQTGSPIDLFGLVHADNQPFAYSMQAFVGAGWLRLQFVATAGNAVVSQIVITQVPYVLQCTCATP
jgi:hypothetical protein